MRKYLGEYVKEIDKKLEEKKITNQDIEEHLIKIEFFQHERLIHLLVTLFYGIFLFLSLIISFKVWPFLLIFYTILVVLIFYVRHYFVLENAVQYLYKQYDRMKKLNKENEQ